MFDQPWKLNNEQPARSIREAETTLRQRGFVHCWLFSWQHQDGTRALIADRSMHRGKGVDVRYKRGDQSYYRSRAHRYRQTLRQVGGARR